MIVRKLIVFLFLISIGCSPPPGNVLLPGLKSPTPIDKVAVTKTVGVIETTLFCNKSSWNNGKKHAVILNCLLNGCIVMGCAEVKWNEEGTITDCNVYAAFDLPIITDHELRHCSGFDDVFH